MIPENVEEFVDEVTNLADEGEITLRDIFAAGGGGGRLPRVAFTAALVNEARAHWGPLKLIESNRLMVRKFMRDCCLEHGVRPSHMAKHIDPAVAIFFIPSESQVMTKQIRQTSKSMNRSQEMRTSWFSGRLPEKVVLPEYEE